MKSIEDFKRSRLPFGKPVPISTKDNEAFTNTFGNVRAIVENGIVSIQVKKHKGSNREIVRINTNANPPTIELVMEE